VYNEVLSKGPVEFYHRAQLNYLLNYFNSIHRSFL